MSTVHFSEPGALLISQPEPYFLNAVNLANLSRPAAAAAECVDDSARDMCGEKNNDCLHGRS